MFSDTHAHLNFSEYNDDNYQIIQDCFQKGISIINVGVNFFLPNGQLRLPNVMKIKFMPLLVYTPKISNMR